MEQIPETYNFSGQQPEEKTYKKKRRLFSFVWLCFLLLLGLYYALPLPMYFWNPSLKFLIRFFYFPLYLFPEGMLYDYGGFMTGPSNFGFLILFLSLFFIYFFFRFFYSTLEKFNFKYKFTFSVLFVAILAVSGGFLMQKKCENDYLNYVNEKGEKYLTNIGLIGFESHLNISRASFSFSGIELLKNEHGNIIAKVQPGKEINKLCRLSMYNDVENTLPITESELFNSSDFSDYWKYIKPEFCGEAGLSSNLRKNCLVRVENSSEKLISSYDSDIYNVVLLSKTSTEHRAEYGVLDKFGGNVLAYLRIYDSKHFVGDISLHKKITLGNYEYYFKKEENGNLSFRMFSEGYEVLVSVFNPEKVNVEDFEKFISTIKFEFTNFSLNEGNSQNIRTE